MPRTTVVKSQSTTVTTVEINLLGSGAITAGSNVNGVPIGDADAYAIQVANTGATDITLRLYLAAGTTAGLRVQPSITATVATGTTWSYQVSGNAMRVLGLTGQTSASSTTIVADLNAVVYS